MGQKVKRTVVISLSSLLILVVIGLGGIAWHFSSKLAYPARKACGPDKYVFCKDPSELNLPFEEISFQTEDGKKINGWYIEKAKNAPAILIVHGFTGSRRAGLRFSPSFYQAGFNILLIDLRGFGTSEPGFTSMGYHEPKDVYAAVDYLVDTKKVSSVGIFGFSMGAATSIIAMAKDKRIQCGIFSGSFTRAYDVVRRDAKRTHGISEYPIVYLANIVYRLRTGVNLHNILPIDHIAKISPRPLFIIQGKKDLIIPPKEGEALYTAAKEPKEIWLPEEADHVRSWNTYRDEAETKTASFFRKCL